MSWVVWILISVSALAISNIFQRILMKDEGSDPVAYTVVFLFVLGVMTGIFAAFKGFVFPPLSDYWFNFLLSSPLYAIGTVIWFKALQKIGSAEATILSSFGAVATIGSAMIFLGEQFVLRQAIGVLLILVSIYLLNKIKGKLQFTTHHFLALLSSVCYGFAITNDAYIIGSGYDAVSYVPIISFFPAVILLAVRPTILSRMKTYMTPSFLKNMFFVTFFYSVQAVTYFVAYESGGNASQIAPISKSSIILTVLLAVIFLKERKNIWRKILSTLLVTAGVLLIA